jgi:hypothetical protein
VKAMGMAGSKAVQVSGPGQGSKTISFIGNNRSRGMRSLHWQMADTSLAFRYLDVSLCTSVSVDFCLLLSRKKGTEPPIDCRTTVIGSRKYPSSPLLHRAIHRTMRKSCSYLSSIAFFDGILIVSRRASQSPALPSKPNCRDPFRAAICLSERREPGRRSGSTIHDPTSTDRLPSGGPAEFNERTEALTLASLNPVLIPYAVFTLILAMPTASRGKDPPQIERSASIEIALSSI